MKTKTAHDIVRFCGLTSRALQKISNLYRDSNTPIAVPRIKTKDCLFTSDDDIEDFIKYDCKELYPTVIDYCAKITSVPLRWFPKNKSPEKITQRDYDAPNQSGFRRETYREASIDYFRLMSIYKYLVLWSITQRKILLDLLESKETTIKKLKSDMKTQNELLDLDNSFFN